MKSLPPVWENGNYLTVEEAKARLGSRTTAPILRAIHSGRLPSIRGNRRYYIHVEDFEIWLEERQERGLVFSSHPGPEYLSLREANQAIGVSSRGPVYKAIRKGELKALMLPQIPRPSWWILREDFEQWLRAPHPGPEYLSPEEVRIRLGLESVSQVIRLIRMQELPARREKGRRRNRWQFWIARVDLEVWLSLTPNLEELLSRHPDLGRPGRGYVSIKHAALLAGLQRGDEVERAVGKGELPAIRREGPFGPRCWIKRTDLRAWLVARLGSDDRPRPGPDYLSVREAAILTGEARATIREAILRKQLKARRWSGPATAARPTLWVRRDRVEAWASSLKHKYPRLPCPGPGFLNVTQAAERAQVELDVLKVGLRNGDLPFLRHEKRRWVHESDLEAWLHEHVEPPPRDKGEKRKTVKPSRSATTQRNIDPDQISVHELCERSGLCRSAVHNRLRSGEIPSSKVDGVYRIERKVAEDWLASLQPGELLTFKEAADLLSVPEPTLRGAYKKGALPGQEVAGAIRIHPGDLEAWAATRKLLSLRQAARLVEVPAYVLSAEIAAGRLPALHPNSWVYRIAEADLREWLTRYQAEEAETPAQLQPRSDGRMRLAQAAEESGLKLLSLKYAARQGHLPAILSDGRYWVRLEDVHAWARNDGRPGSDYVGLTELARESGIPHATLFGAAKTGELATLLTQNPKKLWTRRADLEDWLNRRGVPRYERDRPGPDYLTLSEGAARIGARSTMPLRVAIRRGELAIQKTPGKLGDRYWVRLSDLDAWQAARGKTGQERSSKPPD